MVPKSLQRAGAGLRCLCAHSPVVAGPVEWQRYPCVVAGDQAQTPCGRSRSLRPRARAARLTRSNTSAQICCSSLVKSLQVLGIIVRSQQKKLGEAWR